MILISNIGNRDILYEGKTLERNNIRQRGEDLLNHYEQEKDKLTYPLLEPLIRSFHDKIKNVFIFVTNQADTRVRDSDTLYLGQIIRRWIWETNRIGVNVIEYTSNPTNYERIYRFFTDIFTQPKNIISKTDKRIVSLSGGTPQMNGALYVILSSLFVVGNEFYNIFNGELLPVNQDQTINKILTKKSCMELLEIYEYQSIRRILEENNVENRASLCKLLDYALSRKNFNFEQSKRHLKEFLGSLPSSKHETYDFLSLENISTSPHLIRELLWRMQLSYKNKNYLFLLALLFRLEEALLYEINEFLFKDALDDTLSKKKTHLPLLHYVEQQEPDLWNSLQKVTLQNQSLNLKVSVLSRTHLFFLARLKINRLQKNGRRIYQFDNVLNVFDKINKYNFDLFSPEERKKRYNSSTSTECLGDMRNSSLIAHGFEPVSKEKIDTLYPQSLENLMEELRKNIGVLLVFLSQEKTFGLDNFYDILNQNLLNLLKNL
jgi:hypothetical protein